jgi:hypothetical protein
MQALALPRNCGAYEAPAAVRKPLGFAVARLQFLECRGEEVGRAPRRPGLALPRAAGSGTARGPAWARYLGTAGSDSMNAR